VQQSSYGVDGSNLIIDKGKTGVAIDEESLKKQIINKFVNFEDTENLIEIPVVEQQPEKIDLQKIRNEIYKEPQDAYYIKDPFTIYPHVNGVDFAITIEEAQSLLDTSTEETITIPLKITTPNVTTNQIGTEAFPDLLATYSTTFSTSNTNRTTNIKLASNKINGVVLMPGEEFSYNTVVGQRTAAAGYKTAAVYVNGKVENGIGGGICQVSSTLYNTVLRANLEIVKRSNHRFATGYVPLSTDATVSWGGPEFIFKNSRNYPVKIVSTVNGGKITVSIYGCKEEVEYEVVIQSETLQTIQSKTVYRTNTSLPKGTSKTVQTGHSGYKSRAYRILKLNGTVISKQLLSTDTYAQLETIIEQNP
jgi:vancomycin resistance protein YoaR